MSQEAPHLALKFPQVVDRSTQINTKTLNNNEENNPTKPIPAPRLSLLLKNQTTHSKPEQKPIHNPINQKTPQFELKIHNTPNFIKNNHYNFLDSDENEDNQNQTILGNLLYPKPPDPITKSINLIPNHKTNRNTSTITPLIHNNKTNLLIDSGADVSLIKNKYLSNDKIDTNNTLKLQGIGKGTIQTLGSLDLTLHLNDETTITHKFHSVPNDFPIPEDGIIGRDFFDLYKIDILYSSNQLKIGENLIPFSITTNNHIILPARSETVIEIQTPTNELSICNAQEIQSGIFIPNILIKPENYRAKIIVANTLSQNATIQDFHPDIETILTISNQIGSTDTPKHREEQLSQIIVENLDTSNNVEENMSILSLCMQYQDIFFLEGDKLTSIHGVKHDINLYTDTKPVHVQRYRLPQTHKNEINNQVSEMLQEGKIQPSISPYNSPLLAVPKKPGKDGQPKWRVVVDFRKLNEVTIGDSFPLPNINDILDQLGHAQYFSTLDMASGYHQIEMNPKDAHKTAFSTDYGHFEFTRMPFGLKNSQATFQRAMNHILRGFQGLKGFIYLDDVIIYGKNLNDHNKKLTEVFDICRANNLKLQCTKCQFLKKEITFLGHMITPDGIKPNPSTVQAVQSFPTPKNVRETQSFLGLANYYRRFIPKFSEIAEPLSKLTRKNTPFIFSNECEQAFTKLKNCLTQPPILTYPDLNRPFVLTTDASNYSLGAVLSQIYPTGELPIAYASRALGKSERNYSTIEKEMLAIYWAVNNFRPYLYGKKFSIVTDHKPLTGNITKVPNRILKWNLKMSEYNYEISHKAGKLNTNADSLSRIKHDQVLAITRNQSKNTIIPNNQNPTQISPQQTQLTKTPHQIQNTNTNTPNTTPQSTPLTNLPHTSSKNTFTKNNQITDKINKQTPKFNDNKVTLNTNKIETVFDQDKRQQILKEYHNLPLGGHAGTWRTYKRIKMLYYWPNMLTSINKFIQKCHLCKRNKSHRQTKVPLCLTSTSEYPFQRVAFDVR